MAIQSFKTEDCIDEVFDKYKDMVFRLAFSLVKTRYDAEDVCHEVFMRYIKRNQEFENEEHRKKWLVKVTVNCSKSIFLSSWYKRTTGLDESLCVYSDEGTSEMKIDIRNALLKLPQKYKIVVHLFYFEEMTIKEISEALNIKESTIKTQLRRAREQLKVLLKGGFYDE
ncbi:MAG: sigma-70 family RNA polymerase sigma factor [Clostridiales bacterium]|nr:sigma-70 family RNA polymerase sigma factor [Clostridiales bacterium]